MTETPIAPKWATEYIGLTLYPDRATAAGWIKQNSSQAHYGVKIKKGLWLLKNSSPLPETCGQTFWRFVFIEVNSESKIKVISCQVVAVFADGHGEVVSQHLLEPSDITFAKAALSKATQAGSDISHETTDAWFRAVRKGDISSIIRFINSGIDPNTDDSEGCSALAIAIMNRHDEVVKLLLEAGANPDSGAPKGLTPLMLAARENRPAAIDLLLAAKASVNTISGETWMTAIMYAASPRNTRIIKKLLAAKAYTFLSNRNGDTPAKLYKSSKKGNAFNKAIYKALQD